jgi:hypothetical protein
VPSLVYAEARLMQSFASCFWITCGSPGHDQNPGYPPSAGVLSRPGGTIHSEAMFDRVSRVKNLSQTAPR